jgi:hypothetical protein
MAIGATFIFGLVHVLVIYGIFDSYLVGYSQNSITAADVNGTSWILATWSENPLVWQRALVLYTFGLALHYFVWLKAIPENLQKSEFPNSFRKTISNIRNEVGDGLLKAICFLSIIGTVIWIISFPIGATIYFSISSLHVWIEFVCFMGLIIGAFEKVKSRVIEA